MESFVAGIDLGGTTVKIGLFHMDGSFVEHWEIPTNVTEHGKFILQETVDSLAEHLVKYGRNLSDLRGAGIGVPGAVLPGGEVNQCINLGWGRFPLVKELSRLLGGIPTAAGNDANVAALGEAWKGGGEGYDSMVMVTLGTGVGGGIVIGGKILNGHFGSAGEIGHLQIETDGMLRCACGKTGCLEKYCAAPGMVQLAKRYLQKHSCDSLLRTYMQSGQEDANGRLTAKEIFDAAKKKDAAALAIVEEICDKLGRGLSYITAVVDPEVILIGGGVSKAGDILLEPLRQSYRKKAFHAQTETKILPAVLGNHAGMIGACKLVLSSPA